LPNSKSKPFPQESDRLLNPYLKTVFPQISKALGHERAQFTLVVCSHGSQLQQTFPELILEPREERNAFYKRNCQAQRPNLSQKNQTAY